MQLRFAPYTADHADAWLALFDRAFPDNPEWSGCYCRFYDEVGPTWSSGPDRAAANRAAQEAVLRAGRWRGTVALADDRIVGALNAGARGGFGNLRGYAKAVADPTEPVGAVMCFVVDPAWRRRGVATGLLAAAEAMFAAQGLTVAEAYPPVAPPADAPPTQAFYKGSPAMYARAGYVEDRRIGHFSVMRKALV